MSCGRTQSLETDISGVLTSHLQWEMFHVAVPVLIFVEQKGRRLLAGDIQRSLSSCQQLPSTSFKQVTVGQTHHNVLSQEIDGYYTFHETNKQGCARQGFTVSKCSHLIPKHRQKADISSIPMIFVEIPGSPPPDSRAMCRWVIRLHWLSLEKDRNNVPTVPWRELERKCQPTAYAGYWACRHCSRVGTRRAQASACKDEAKQKWILADGWMGCSILSLRGGPASHTEAQSPVSWRLRNEAAQH